MKPMLIVDGQLEFRGLARLSWFESGRPSQVGPRSSSLKLLLFRGQTPLRLASNICKAVAA